MDKTIIKRFIRDKQSVTRFMTFIFLFILCVSMTFNYRISPNGNVGSRKLFYYG